MSCLDNKKNLGVGRCSDLPGLIRGIITTPKSFKISESDSTDQTVWQAALVAAKNARIYLWPRFSTVPEFIGKEDVFQDNPVAYNHVLDGTYGWKAMISKSLCFHKAAFSHFTSDERVWLIDHKNKIIGTYLGDEEGEAMFGGFTTDVVKALNMHFNNGTDPSATPVVFYLKDANEVNDPIYGAIMIDAPFVNRLAVLTDVTLTMGTITTTDLEVTVTVACDETPVSGLVAADFAVTQTDGTTQVIDTVTESSTEAGKYTIHRASGSYVSGFVALVAPASLSVYPDSAYEASAVAFVGD